MQLTKEMQTTPINKWKFSDILELAKLLGWQLKKMAILELNQDYSWDEGSSYFAVPIEDFKNFSVGTERWVADDDDECRSFDKSDFVDLFDWIGILDDDKLDVFALEDRNIPDLHLD